MLKRIHARDIRLGMYIHEFCGSWLSHPFWRTQFLLSDPEDLRRIQDSALTELWINTARGLDVATAQAIDASESAHPPPPPPPPDRPQVQPVSLKEELARAAKICDLARKSVTSMFQEARMGSAIEANTAMPVICELSDSVMRNPGALISLARLKTADNYTYMHSVAVAALMIALARQMQLTEAEIQTAGLAGMMHDVGKMKVPLAILNKNGKLTEEEFALMKQHPRMGHEILKAGQDVAPEVLDVCLSHHEKIDGSGYPNRIGGEAISPFARMGAICDVYDAITSERPYKSGWDPAESLHRMSEWRGHLDMNLFRAFVKRLGIYPNGSLVRLNSGRIGVVTEQGASLLKPTVRVFFSTRGNRRIPPEIVRLSHPQCPEKIIAREEPEDWHFQDLHELWAIPAG
ncbi:MAG: HD-GYP domain-containing protein [Zoogloeaceae bacterium]|nr:HD-GYP domain-containing protein [Zoogloeaceae bacterium]